MVEHDINKREINMPGALHVKNSQADLVKGQV